MFRYFTTVLLLCTAIGMTIAQRQLTDSLSQEIVITHSKKPQSTKKTSKSIVVIDKEQIQKSGALDISQILDAQIGMTINGANSNPGLNKTTYIQGGSGENLLFLIDGMPVSDPTSIGGPFDIRTMDITSIERIEILRGSQSTLYGSSAIAGVVNIITTKATNKPFALSGQTQYATYGNLLQGLTASGSTGNFSYKVSTQYNTSKGISEAKQPKSATTEFDKDGFDKTNLSVQLGYDITSEVTVSPFYRYGTYDGDYDAGALADAPNKYETDYTQYGGRLTYASKAWTSNLDYSETQTNRKFVSAFGTNLFDGTMRHLDWYNTLSINDQNQIMLGVNYQKISMQDTTATPNNPDDNIVSAYANYLTNPTDEWSVEVGYRYNNHSRFGAHSSYELATSYWITPALKAQASYSTGFKAPLLSQLYGKWGANLELKPQTSKYLQAGLQYHLSEQSIISANYFNREVNDVIIYKTDPVTYAGGYVNQPQQKTNGLEIALSTTVTDGLRLSLDYTYLTGETIVTENGSTTVTSEELLRRPKHRVGGRLSYAPTQQWNAYISLDNVGNRSERYFDTSDYSTKAVTLDQYTLINIGGSYAPVEQLTISAAIFNAFDTKYEELFGYNTLGRHARLSLHYRL